VVTNHHGPPPYWQILYLALATEQVNSNWCCIVTYDEWNGLLQHLTGISFCSTKDCFFHSVVSLPSLSINVIMYFESLRQFTLTSSMNENWDSRSHDQTTGWVGQKSKPDNFCHNVVHRQKVWKLAGSGQRYGKNYQAYFFGPSCISFDDPHQARDSDLQDQDLQEAQLPQRNSASATLAGQRTFWWSHVAVQCTEHGRIAEVVLFLTFKRSDSEMLAENAFWHEITSQGHSRSFILHSFAG